MADPSEPEAGGATATAEPDETTGSRPEPGGRRRTLDRRTIAIGAVLGIVAALLTVLVASTFVSDDDSSADGAMQLQEPVDAAALLSTKLDTVDGGTTTLAAFQEGKPMLVNLWQSFCRPCVDEMPLLDAARTKNPDVTFVGVATQDTVAKATALAKKTGITYPWALDPSGEFFFEAQGVGMPTTLLLSADGEVIDSKTGAFKSADQLQAFLDQAS
jgi:thiol-disulfide isomerase/thioredoxin